MGVTRHRRRGPPHGRGARRARELHRLHRRRPVLLRVPDRAWRRSGLSDVDPHADPRRHGRDGQRHRPGPEAGGCPAAHRPVSAPRASPRDRRMLWRRRLLLIEPDPADVSAAEEARGLASSARVRAFSFVVLAAASWGIEPSEQAGGGRASAADAARRPAVRQRFDPVDRAVVDPINRSGTPIAASPCSALLNPGLAYALSLIGLTMISASASVLIWAIEPILILLLAGLVLGERPGPAITGSVLPGVRWPCCGGGQPRSAAWRLAGVALSLVGVLCCVSTASPPGDGSRHRRRRSAS